jgi:hypothetical protein
VQLYTHQKIGAVSDLAIYRAILDCWGLHGGFSRDPFYPLTPAQRESLTRQLDETGWATPRSAASFDSL